MSSAFNLRTSFEPKGDQPQAIEQLVRGLNEGEQHLVLLALVQATHELLDRLGLVPLRLEAGAQVERGRHGIQPLSLAGRGGRKLPRTMLQSRPAAMPSPTRPTNLPTKATRP